MFYHLKIIIRNLFHNGLYSIINIAGLAVSLTAVILILLWIQNELSFDKFHERSKDIHLALTSYYSGTYWTSSSPAMAPAANTEIPEIENACRISENTNVRFLKYNENMLTDVYSSMVDSSFFSIFDFKIKEGNVNALLPDEQSVILSESAAKVLFGSEEPVGKIILDNAERPFHVTGIIADMPQKSSLRYNVIFAYTLPAQQNQNMGSLWRSLACETYFLLKPGVKAETVTQKLNAVHQKNDSWELAYSLFPLEKQNLYHLDGMENSKMQACRLFSIAVGVLLLIACINYVNLVTSRASRRNKEIFVRNVMGARKRNLFAYFFNESLLLFLCSMAIATFLIWLLFPFYNQITDGQLEFRILSASTLTVYGLAFAVTTLFAGIYPALKLSYGKVVQKTSSANAFIRRTLVVLQFSASVILILAAVTFNRQLHYIKTMHPGYDKEQVFYVQLPQEMSERKDDVKARLMQIPGIEGITFTGARFTDLEDGGVQVGWEGKDSDREGIFFSFLYTDENFIPVMNVNMAEGANFTGTSADNTYCIVNRTAVKVMGLQEPVGKRLYVLNGRQIVGVTDDFHFQNMHEPVKPLMITVSPQAKFMYVKVGAHNVPNTLKTVENLYKQYNSELPFNYSFIDDEFDRLYKSDVRTGRLFNIFSLIAILVSCLGLLGLVTYTAETKAREIGIRKVLGASVASIVGMLSREFLILVCIAMLIAFPTAYYLMDRLLQDYAYRIALSWWIFALAGIITVVLTIITVGWQAIKAATANPVKAIKVE